LENFLRGSFSAGPPYVLVGRGSAVATAPGGVLRLHKMGRDKEANLVLELRRSDVLGIKPIGEF